METITAGQVAIGLIAIVAGTITTIYAKRQLDAAIGMLLVLGTLVFFLFHR